MNFKGMNLNYGPGRGVNTSQTFHVKAEFKSSGGRLTQFCINTSQNGQSAGHCIGDSDVPYGYFDAVKDDLARGMTFAMSNWGSDWNTMKWLDGNTGCGGNCGNPTVHYSNISIVTGGASPTPGPTPTPGSGKWSCNDGGCTNTGSGQHADEGSCLSECTASYNFGDSCASKNADLCGDSCNDCAWSWPKSGTWSSPDAHCRCKAAYNCKQKYWSDLQKEQQMLH